MRLLRKLWITVAGRFIAYDRTCRECRRPLERGQYRTCSVACQEQWESTSAW